MQTTMNKFCALDAALLLTTIFAAPIALGEGSGDAPTLTIVDPIAIA